MTNPTLERAAEAVRTAMGGDLPSILDCERVARAVLMAVLPNEADSDGAPEWMDPAQAYGWGCGFNACRDAILAEGE